ncbi:hypothetical protein VTO73DRAFT_202 [Trametes versicolor]
MCRRLRPFRLQVLDQGLMKHLSKQQPHLLYNLVDQQQVKRKPHPLLFLLLQALHQPSLTVFSPLHSSAELWER